VTFYSGDMGNTFGPKGFSTPVMVLRLGKLCGNGPDLWLNLHKRYDLQRAEQELGEKIKAIPTLQVA
jgi:antitoxin HigA-1